ncbi:5-methylcytosine-specific restriction system specificity protein McrC [Agrobacterium sp. fls2-241-TYG-188a]|uniref:5-methylcytosine restriction system specificity protein McrC n=1 Tax=Agrobacterium sp. fls2-241-TYG-188a TaxID=3040275 RepID=UPI0033060A7B
MNQAMWKSAAGIPIRNLWVLLTYAAGLAQFGDLVEGDVDDATELPDLLARYLCDAVERRLRRNLSLAYRSDERALTRVRGRINWLQTETRGLLQQGRVACQFEEFTFDTPRNRLAVVALRSAAARIRDTTTADRCRRLAGEFAAKGVCTVRPTASELRRDAIARHQRDDFHMVTVANLALDLVLPSEEGHEAKISRLERDEIRLRRIFEVAVAQYYFREFHGRDGWTVSRQKRIKWKSSAHSERARALVPGMIPDIRLDQGSARRVVIDTKFANVLTPKLRGGHSFVPANIFQIFAYLASQSGSGSPLSDVAEGILLYPSVGVDIDEYMTVRGHKIRFTTVNLAATSDEMLFELRSKISS